MQEEPEDLEALLSSCFSQKEPESGGVQQTGSQEVRYSSGLLGSDRHLALVQAGDAVRSV